MSYTLTFAEWEKLGCPDEIEEYVVDVTEDGYVLEGYPDENDNDIPDFLDGYTSGGDVILNPSHGTIGG